MSIEAWQTLLDTFALNGEPILVSSAALDDFVARTGFELPESYREFCSVFGPCRLMETRYRFSVPGGVAPYFDIRTLNEDIKKESFELKYIQDADQFVRSWLFATDIATSFFFWDPMDVTDASRNECGVYIIHRDYRVERLAGTFWDFVNTICVETGVPEYGNEGPEERIFEAP